MTQLIHVAARLGIAEQLKDGPRSVAELAKATGSHPDSLYRLMRALAGLGVFAEEEQMRFRLTPAAELLLPGVPGSVRAEALVAGEDFMWKSWGSLIHSIRTGETAFDHLFGRGTWDWFKDHPREARLFDELQAEGTRRASDSIVRAWDFSSSKTIVDVAGGNGQLLSAILSKNPRVRCVLFELQHVVEAARRNPLPELEGRCEFVAGNFFQSVPGGGDVYILKYIVHDFNDDQAISLLKNVRKAMPRGAKLLVIEELICGANESCRSKVSDITMMVRNGGRNRTEAEYRKLLTDAGFDVLRIVPAESDLAIIESTPAATGRAWTELLIRAEESLSKGRTTDSERILAEAIRNARRDGEFSAGVADAMIRLGSIRHDLGRIVEAEQMYRESLNVSERLPAPNLQTAAALQGLGGVRLAQGRTADAGKLYRKATDIQILLYGRDSAQAAGALRDLAEVYWETGWEEEAKRTAERAARTLSTAGPSPQLGSAYFLLSKIAKRQRRDRDAEEFMRQVVEVWRVAPGPNHPAYASGLTGLAVLVSATDPNAADRLFLEALEVVEALPDNGGVLTGFTLSLYGKHLQTTGRKAEGRQTSRRGQTILARHSRDNQLGHTIDISALERAWSK